MVESFISISVFVLSIFFYFFGKLSIFSRLNMRVFYKATLATLFAHLLFFVLHKNYHYGPTFAIGIISQFIFSIFIMIALSIIENVFSYKESDK